MAKEKIRKLIKERDILNKNLNHLTSILAVLASRGGGEIRVTKEQLISLPQGTFSIDYIDNTTILKLNFEDPTPTIQSL